ncbi:hypothetical protein GYMLUDRAFT_174987, partial [Collybiopsis luxurians FD-317 M1]
TKAFAQATSQEFHIHFSKDWHGRGKNKKEIQGLAVEGAHNLGGRVLYIPGMPVFGMENIATELGLSKGSLGTLVSITFKKERN